MRFLLTLLLLGLPLTGCSASGALGNSAVGPTWQLTALGPDAASGATLIFDADGRVSGTTGCNSYFGEYAVGRGGALTLSDIGSTLMACDSASMAQETRFIDALGDADRLVIQGDRLVLMIGERAGLTFTSASADATLTGTVTYRQRIALPPDAVLSVMLLDVSRADAPSVTLAETRFGTDGAQVPLPFTLRYDSGTVQARNRYVVRAVIHDAGGALLWTTDTAYPVLTQGAPTDGVELMLTQVNQSGRARSLVGATWALMQIRRPDGTVISPGDAARFSIAFGADGGYSGQADCNRYGGMFEAGAEGTLTLSQGLSTLAACPDPHVDSGFFGVLNTVDRYVLTADGLTLNGADGGALEFEAVGETVGEGSMPSQETRRDIAYVCPSSEGPFTVRTRTGPGELAVWLPERFADRDGGTYLVLGQVRAASGVRYQDGPVTVWTKGLTDASIDVDGLQFPDCKA